MKRQLFSLSLLVVLSLSLLVSVVYADIDTVVDFELSFAVGEAFNVADEYRGTTYTFTVASGSLTGTASLSVTSGLGSLTITPTASCTVTVSGYNPATTVYVDGAIYTSGGSISLVAGRSVTISWKSTSVIVVGDGEVADLYFRSDSYSTLGVEAYGLDSDYTNVYTSVNSSASGAVDFDYGFRVWLFEDENSTTELTGGSPIGVISLSSDVTGYRSATYDFEGSEVTFGYEALKIVVYERQDAGVWTAKATFISDVLLTDYLQPSTWTFQLYVTYDNDAVTTTSAFTFGSSSYRSGLYNFVFAKALESQLQWWRLTHGDLVGFLIGGYVDLMGETLYAFILFGIAASMYRRYGHGGPIVFFFVVFGGVGGIVWLFVPLWAAVVVATFVILFTTFIVWRIIR